MRIEVGYGLEGALPDTTSKRILDEEIRPRFRRAISLEASAPA